MLSDWQNVIYGFIHISKTAGTTVRAFFSIKIFGEDAVLNLDAPDECKRCQAGKIDATNVRAVVGHIYYPLDALDRCGLSCLQFLSHLCSLRSLR